MSILDLYVLPHGAGPLPYTVSKSGGRTQQLEDQSILSKVEWSD